MYQQKTIYCVCAITLLSTILLENGFCYPTVQVRSGKKKRSQFCQSPFECEEPLYCLNNTRKGFTCSFKACRGHKECRIGQKCSGSGTCSSIGCVLDADCAGITICGVEKYCNPRGSKNSPCSRNAQCWSKECTNGTCTSENFWEGVSPGKVVAIIAFSILTFVLFVLASWFLIWCCCCIGKANFNG